MNDLFPSRTYSRFFGWSVVDSVWTRGLVTGPGDTFYCQFSSRWLFSALRGPAAPKHIRSYEFSKPLPNVDEFKNRDVYRVELRWYYFPCKFLRRFGAIRKRFLDENCRKLFSSRVHSFIETSPIIPRFIILIMFESGYKFNKSLGTLMAEKRRGCYASSDDKATRSSKR